MVVGGVLRSRNAVVLEGSGSEEHSRDRLDNASGNFGLFVWGDDWKICFAGL